MGTKLKDLGKVGVICFYSHGTVGIQIRIGLSIGENSWRLDMITDISKVLLVVGLLFIIVKGLGKRPSTYPALYNLHKAGPALATILAFVHGLTIDPIDQTYATTGWFLGLSMLALFALGIFMGFNNKWVPFDDQKDAKFKKLRILKWILTATVIVALASHYLLV